MAKITLEKKQARIVHALEGPLFVSAGAGSGKTFTLTQRVLYALTPGSKPREQWADQDVPEAFLDSIDQVLAITFTDKAAQELKERIRSGLRDAGLMSEAEKVDDAWISTIHGMCSRIIRAHALDLGIDPVFGVAGYADDLKRLAVEHVLRRVSAEDTSASAPYAALLHAFAIESQGGSMSIASLLDMLIAILSKVCTMVEGFEAFEQVTPKPSHIDLYEAYRNIAETPSYANCEAARAAIEALDAYLASPRDLEALRACFAGCDKLGKRARGMGKDEKAFVDEVRAALPSFFAEAYLRLSSDALDELMPLAREVEAEYRRLKHDRSLLDNDDLLTRAYDALTTDERIREEFAGKFKMVMVDEFQDTAQQQVELVSLLCSPDGRELCTVGDAQQSIYRFRGADVSVFRTKKEAVEHSGAGEVCSLDVNYRSHADILTFADRIFEGGAESRLGRDFLHLVSCGEESRKDARAVGAGTSRRQALLVAGGTADERSRAKAEAIAERFKTLRDTEGFAPSDMVILMARLTRADIYAEAMREQGLPCVVSGGTSVFRRAPEVGIIAALLAFLANPDDGERGITPLITSPLFELGATELLALSTCVNAETKIRDTRSLSEEVVLRAPIMEEFGELPLIERMREVLGRALARCGRDRVSEIVRDVVAASGWLARLEQGGAKEQAIAANVLKALAIVEEEERGRAFSPRLVSEAFDAHIAHIKESPAVLSGAGEDAVRIMTVHASKGLEFPVVAVAECDAIRTSADCIQFAEHGEKMRWTALPNRFEPASDKAITALPEPDPDDLETMPARASEAFSFMRREANTLDYEERARLFYVALTRAREIAILAFSAGSASELEPGHATSLVGEVLSRILPADPVNSDLPDLTADRLAIEGAHEGDFQMILLEDLKYPAKKAGLKRLQRVYHAVDYPRSVSSADSAPVASAARSVELVWPEDVSFTLTPAAPRPRDSYSYSSMAAALHEEGEDRAAAPVLSTSDEEQGAIEEARGAFSMAPARSAARSRSAAADSQGDPTALGSAFHAAAQWLIETGAETVPAARQDILARYWRLTASQRARFTEALARWERSQIRSEMRTWPVVRAEVPFFSIGLDEVRERFGAYAEGAIDVVCTDPALPGEALVLDYKTGGDPGETPGGLQKKHDLQATVYADVLHRAGFDRVRLVFVRVEVEDPERPGEPQLVVYER